MFRTGQSNSARDRQQRGPKSGARILPLGLLLLVSSGPLVAAEGWPHWRGAQRDGMSLESSGWTGKWAPKPVWSTNVGEGGSSPIVVDGRIYVVGWRNNQDHVACRRLADSEVIWTQSYASPQYGRHSTGDKGIYSGFTATPEYDEQTQSLFTLSNDGELRCWGCERGEQRWRLNLYDEFKVPRRPDVGRRRSLRDYGYTASPMVYGPWLLVEVGSRGGNLVALDKTTGRRIWSSECKDEAGHTAGPVMLSVDGDPCVAVLTLRNLVIVSLDPSEPGRTIASAKWTTDFGNNIASPAVMGESVIVTSAYNHFAMARFDVSAGKLLKKWATEGIASGVCTPIIHRDRIYWAWRGVHCLDFNTGKELWVGGKVGSPGSCILTGDERLIVQANRGDLSLVETAKRSPSKFTELVRLSRQLSADAWPHVVLASGRILCKDRKGNLKCLRID